MLCRMSCLTRGGGEKIVKTPSGTGGQEIIHNCSDCLLRSSFVLPSPYLNHGVSDAHGTFKSHHVSAFLGQRRSLPANCHSSPERDTQIIAPPWRTLVNGRCETWRVFLPSDSDSSPIIALMYLLTCLVKPKILRLYFGPH